MKSINLKNYIIFFIGLWTLTIAFALVHSMSERRQQVEENEQITAKVAYQKDLMYRRWASKQGGVYVHISEHTPPNPYLKYIKNRDVVTNNGDSLTLVNPAYMTRQVLEFAKTDYDLPGHLISLNPINPINKPNNVEKEALLAFEKGDTLFIKEDTIDGKIYVRYLRPFVTEQSCLKCHEQQGYQIGQIRGALSIAVPTAEFERVKSKYIKTFIFNYFIVWFIGICLILFILNKLRKQIVARNIAEKTIAYQNTKLLETNSELLAQTEELRQITEHLENANKEITESSEKYQKLGIELTALNNDLELKNQTLNELVATKDKLFSIIAHDLRNPFNVLLGYTQLLELEAMTFPPEKVQQFAQSMNTASKHAFLLLENLLEWSKIQTGKLKPNPVALIPSEIIEQTVQLLESSATSKNIALQSIIKTDDSVFADKEMIKTVLRNLMSNALKFTFPNGKVTITVQNFENEVQFIVSDTGIGIDPANFSQLFKINSKLSKKGTADEKGTGLGLMLCKEFIEVHNGRIWVESMEGKGSDFKFTLPIYNESENKIDESKSLEI